MTTSKSPLRILQVAYDAAREAVPDYSHVHSPKKFTQPQLLACLAIKEFLRLDDRGLADHRVDHAEMVRLLGLTTVPHDTTFQKAAARLLVAAPAQKLFDAVLARARALRDLRSARSGSPWRPSMAPDWSRTTSAGTMSNAGTRPEVAPRKRLTPNTRKSFWSPTAGPIWCCRRCPAGAPASDLVLFQAALKQAVGRARIGTLLADADFDGEWVHERIRSYGIRDLIPPTRGRPSEKLPAGKWRRRMKQRFNKKKYGQRWQTEIVNSMIKRRLGSALRARSYWSQCREIILRAITHNAMVVASG